MLKLVEVHTQILDLNTTLLLLHLHQILLERTADPPLVLLDDLQQLHARPLDGVEHLQTREDQPEQTSSVAVCSSGGSSTTCCFQAGKSQSVLLNCPFF